MQLVAALLLGAAAPSSLPAQAMPGEAGADDDDRRQRFLSLRATVYTRQLLSATEHDWAAKLRLRASLGLYEIRAVDELLIPDTSTIESVGLRTVLDFQRPLPVDDVSFVPSVELVANHVLDDASNDFAAAVTAALRYRRDQEPSAFTVTTGVKYGTRFEDDGVNIDDYVELSVATSLEQSMGVGLGRRQLILRPYAKASYYVDDLEFASGGGAIFDVGRQLELGFELNVAPRLGLGKIKLPGPRITYVFGDDTRGLRIRF